MKYYLVILFTLLSFYSKSQLVSESRTNSIFTYIYQLENSEVKELLSKYHYHIPEHFFTNKIDSFYNDITNELILIVGDEMGYIRIQDLS